MIQGSAACGLQARASGLPRLPKPLLFWTLLWALATCLWAQPDQLAGVDVEVDVEVERLAEGKRPPGVAWSWTAAAGRPLEDTGRRAVALAEQATREVWSRFDEVDWVGLSAQRQRAWTVGWRPASEPGVSRTLGVGRDRDGNRVVALAWERVPGESAVVFRWMTVFVTLDGEGRVLRIATGIQTEVRE